MRIRARLNDGTTAQYIGQDGDNYVVRLNDDNYVTVPELVPEFDDIPPMWITGNYQPDGSFAIVSWPSQEMALNQAKRQLATYGHMIPIGRIVYHDGLIVIADTAGKPLRVAT